MFYYGISFQEMRKTSYLPPKIIIFGEWECFHIMIISSIELQLIWATFDAPPLKSTLHDIWQCPNKILFPWLGKLCQATRWSNVPHIPDPCNNIAMSNAIFQKYTKFPFMPVLISGWSSHLTLHQWGSYLVNVHNLSFS